MATVRQGVLAALAMAIVAECWAADDGILPRGLNLVDCGVCSTMVAVTDTDGTTVGGCLKNNCTASAAPTTGDDSGDGYGLGSRWMDTTNDRTYVLADATVGAAVWRETGNVTKGTAWSILRTNSGATDTEWKNEYRTLAADVTCAVSASYCTIWSVTPTVASAGVTIHAMINIIAPDATVAPQFRVSSADAGYTGMCYWQLWNRASGTISAPTYHNEAIGTAPGDTAGTAWAVVDPTLAEVRCTLLADASPGEILVEWQLETGTTPTQTVQKGSTLTVTQN